MVQNKLPTYRLNSAPSEFVPTMPVANMAMQNTEVKQSDYNGIDIDTMRACPEVFDKSFSGINKEAVVNAAMIKSSKDVVAAAKRSEQAMVAASKGRGFKLNK